MEAFMDMLLGMALMLLGSLLIISFGFVVASLFGLTPF